MGAKISVTQPTKEELDAIGISSWPTWTCPVSEFDWQYSDKETCYFYKGKVIVHTDDGDVEIKAGDLVVFPKGLKCRWEVLEPVEKVYSFGD